VVRLKRSALEHRLVPARSGVEVCSDGVRPQVHDGAGLPLSPGYGNQTGYNNYNYYNNKVQDYYDDVKETQLAAAATTTASSRPLLAAKLDALNADPNNDCLAQLEKRTGKSFDQIKAFAGTLNYYAVGGPAGGLTLSQVGVASATDMTLQEYFGSNTQPGQSNPAAAVPLGNPVVLLGGGYYYDRAVIGNQTFWIPTTNAEKQNTLFHELWHTLGIGDLGSSAAFDAWLSGGCQGKAPGE